MAMSRIMYQLKKHPAVRELVVLVVRPDTRPNLSLIVSPLFQVVPVFVITIGGAAFAAGQIFRSATTYTDVSLVQCIRCCVATCIVAYSLCSAM